MSRRRRKDRKRNRNKRPIEVSQPETKSYSDAYEAGTTVGYNYRIRGPQFPVTVTKMDPADMN